MNIQLTNNSQKIHFLDCLGTDMYALSFDSESGTIEKAYPIPSNYVSKSKLIPGTKVYVRQDLGNKVKVCQVPEVRSYDAIYNGDYTCTIHSEDNNDGCMIRISKASISFYGINRGDTIIVHVPAVDLEADYELGSLPFSDRFKNSKYHFCSNFGAYISKK